MLDLKLNLFSFSRFSFVKNISSLNSINLFLVYSRFLVYVI